MSHRKATTRIKVFWDLRQINYWLVATRKATDEYNFLKCQRIVITFRKMQHISTKKVEQDNSMQSKRVAQKLEMTEAELATKKKEFEAEKIKICLDHFHLPSGDEYVVYWMLNSEELSACEELPFSKN